MKPPTSPREINRQLYLNLHQDGIMDMLGGSIVISFGLIPILDTTGMGPGLQQVILLFIYFIEILAVILLKQHVTYPRAGRVILRPEKRKSMAMVLLLVNVAIFLLMAGSYLLDWNFLEGLGQYRLSVMLGSIFLLMFSVTGALLKVPRFHAYGLLVLGSFLFFGYLFNRGHGNHEGIPSAAFASGGAILLSGIYQFIVFLGKYQKDS